jgi:hypothetical protein
VSQIGGPHERTATFTVQTPNFLPHKDFHMNETTIIRQPQIAEKCAIIIEWLDDVILTTKVISESEHAPHQVKRVFERCFGDVEKSVVVFCAELKSAVRDIQAEAEAKAEASAKMNGGAQ